MRPASSPASPRSVRVPALLALVAGLLIYLIARPVAPLGLPSLHLQPAAGTPLAVLVGSAPAFLHAFAFALLLGSLARDRAGAARSCAAWMLIACAIEIGQAHAVRGYATAGLGLLLPGPVAEPFRAYLRMGVFDPFDLVATTLGCVVAWRCLVKRRFADTH